MTRKDKDQFYANIRYRYQVKYKIYDTFNEWWSDYPFNEEEHRIPCRAAWKAAAEHVLKQKLSE